MQLFSLRLNSSIKLSSKLSSADAAASLTILDFFTASPICNNKIGCEIVGLPRGRQLVCVCVCKQR